MWIARDADGELYLYRHRPTKLRSTDRFIDKRDPGFFYSCLNKEMYSEVTWENSPKELKAI